MANPMIRPGTLTVDNLAKQALKETESAAAVFIPSIPNNPLKPPAPAVTAQEPSSPTEETPETPSLSPIDRWQASLKKANLTESEAYAILDAVIKKGFWEKEYSLWNGKMKCTFRTRDAHHLLRVRKEISNADDRSDYSVSQSVFRANMAGSLSSYQNVVLPFANLNTASTTEIEQSYEVRYEFVGKIPGPIYEQLVVALSNFDTVVSAAISEGAAQSF